MTKTIRTLLMTTAICTLLFAAAPAKAAEEPADTKTTNSTVVIQTRLTVKDVKEIQGRLAEKGFYKSKIDGQFGQGTQDAIRAYQDSEGLEANGYPTTPTLEKLGVTPENHPVIGGAEPPGKGGVVYTETIEQKDVASKTTKGSGFASVNSASQNGGSCLTCSNGPIGNGGTSSMHSNEY